VKRVEGSGIIEVTSGRMKLMSLKQKEQNY